MESNSWESNQENIASLPSASLGQPGTEAGSLGGAGGGATDPALVLQERLSAHLREEADEINLSIDRGGVQRHCPFLRRAHA